MPMDNVKLCTDCKLKRFLSDQPGPCGAYPDKLRLKEARDLCQGNDFQPRYLKTA